MHAYMEREREREREKEPYHLLTLSPKRNDITFIVSQVVSVGMAIEDHGDENV